VCAEGARRPLAAGPNKLAAGRGFDWWSEAWRLFWKATGLWIGIGAVLLLICTVLSLIPVVGALALSLFSPVFFAGLMLGCRSLDSGGGLTFDHLFAGFQNNLDRLLTIGALWLFGWLAIYAIIFIALDAGFAVVIALLVLVGSLLSIPLTMSVWFAPALVVLHGMTALEAMKLSFRGCLRNILPFLLYGLMGIMLEILAILPLGLGLLVLVPVIFCSFYIIIAIFSLRALIRERLSDCPRRAAIRPLFRGCDPGRLERKENPADRFVLDGRDGGMEAGFCRISERDRAAVPVWCSVLA
jgi:hypothetical protein